MKFFDRYPILKTVQVTTKTDKCFRGILWRRNGKLLVLKNAQLLRRNQEAMPFDGEVLVLSDNVDFIQVVN